MDETGDPRHRALSPEEVRQLAETYDSVLAELAESGLLNSGAAASVPAHEVRRMVAKALFAEARLGPLEPGHLRAVALKALDGTVSAAA